MTPTQVFATEALKHMVVWMCWHCKHELHLVPDDPFGPCPACGKSSSMNELYSRDYRGVVMILTRASQAPDLGLLPSPEEQVAGLSKLAKDLLALFWQEGHPGEPAIRTGWVRMADLHEMRKELSRLTGEPTPKPRRGPTAPDSIPGGM